MLTAVIDSVQSPECENGRGQMGYIVVAGIAFAIGWFLAFSDTSQRERSLQSREDAAKAEHARREADLARQQAASTDEIERERRKFDQHRATWRAERDRLLDEVREFREALDTGFLQGRKWLADAFSEYIQTRDYELACSLVVKPSPALKGAEAVSQIGKKRAEMARQLKMLQFQLASYEEYFPVLLEYRDAILDEVVDLRNGASEALKGVDPALGLGILSKEEYEKLPNVEKFQLALDRYWAREKSKLEIGRVYERYVGYLYEREGWAVSYQGIEKGLEDFGRDLICQRDGDIHIVQCKCWSKDKQIREKHILQLYGTTVLYRIHHQQSSQQLLFDITCEITPVFAATTNLSDDARMVAEHLKVVVRDEPLKRYPMIKCNVNADTGERIYHLPFDQQYDRVIVGKDPGEFYAETTAEAEAAGFRRAYRWRGGDDGGRA
ncbi:MAG: hypothetical protein DWQ41_13230 [Planctomycetota bacterium]|nr:MAG: hypothetical protein DWQ41_13230 [Planctomycetota bacterium]